MKTRKLRLLSFVLAVAMMFAVMPVSAFAAETTLTTFKYEYMGQTLNYEVIDPNKNFVKLAHNENIKGDVIIPKTVENNGKYYTVVEIGSDAINNGGERWNNAPTTIKMPSTITKINSSAFNNNWSLTQIEIPASVEDIGAWAFQWCGVVTKVTFEEGSKLKTIGQSAFSSCKQVKEFVVPEGVTTIMADAFGGCDALESLVIPSTVTSIGIVSGHGLVDDNGKVVIKYNGSDDSVFEGKIPRTLKVAHPHNVSFVMNGHGTPLKNQTVYTGCKIEKVAEPTATAEGYNFAGWYTDEGLTQKFDVENDTIPGDTTLYAKWEKIPDHQLTVTGGTFTVKDENVETKTEGDTLMADIPEGAEVTVIFSKDAYADSNLTFDGWKIEGLVDAENYTNKEEFTFTMPKNGVTIAAQTKAAAPAEDDSLDAATVVTGVVLGTGTAILAYHIGIEVYAEQVLGKGVVVPTLRGDVARKARELAGKPAVTVAGNEAPDEDAQAQQWVVDQGLMKDRKDGKFHPDQRMSKLKALRTLDAAKKLG